VRVGFGCDHRGFAAKEWIIAALRQFGHECVDFGTNDRDPVDYPDIAYAVVRAVVETQVDRAILVDATGIGMPIAANKIKGILAAFCHDELSARLAREHMSVNVLCLSADHADQVLTRRIIEVWLSTGAGSGRHERRTRKIAAIEAGRDPREIQ